MKTETKTENDALMEIVRLASAALAADLTETKRRALADIFDALASTRTGKETPEARASGTGQDAAPADDPNGLRGLDKWNTVAPGVKLVRFDNADEVRLLARRKGYSDTPNAVFEIEVCKPEKCAAVSRDGRTLFEVQGYATNYSVVESLAIDALRRYLKICAKRNRRTRRHEKRDAAKRAAARAGWTWTGAK